MTRNYTCLGISEPIWQMPLVAQYYFFFFKLTFQHSYILYHIENCLLLFNKKLLQNNIHFTFLYQIFFFLFFFTHQPIYVTMKMFKTFEVTPNTFVQKKQKKKKKKETLFSPTENIHKLLEKKKIQGIKIVM
jgi:hypothetical protein